MALKQMTLMSMLFDTLVYASLIHVSSAPIGLLIATP